MKVQSKVNGELLEILEIDERRSPVYPNGVIHVRPVATSRKSYWICPTQLKAA